jgi:hypothetical protein
MDSYRMDIGYFVPGEHAQSIVPVVAWGDDGTWRLCDGAYDVLEHVSRDFYAAWERIVCSEVAAKLETCPDGYAQTFVMPDGSAWEFSRVSSDFSPNL